MGVFCVAGEVAGLADRQRVAQISDGLMKVEADVADGQPRDLGDFPVTQSGLQPQSQHFLLAWRKLVDQLVQMNFFFGVASGLGHVGCRVGYGHLRRVDGRRVIGTLHVDHSASADGKQPSRDARFYF